MRVKRHMTVHPSYLLRLPDEQRKREEYTAFVRDLRRAAELAKKAAEHDRIPGTVEPRWRCLLLTLPSGPCSSVPAPRRAVPLVSHHSS